jgi:hypothetical protein
MNRPPPLPNPAGRKPRPEEDEQFSNYFWTVTLVCLCLIGILLLILLLTLVQGAGSKGAGAGNGAGEVAGADGAGEEASQTAGSGAKDDSAETGSTSEPAEIPPEQAGNEAELSEQVPAANSPAAPASPPSGERNRGGLTAPPGSAPLDGPVSDQGEASSEQAGATEPAEKDKIDFGEPDPEAASQGTSAEDPVETESVNEPRSKGPEIGLFSKPEASFFGVNVEAEKVAFVVDASSSMLGPTPEGWKTKFVRLKEELMRSVEGLSDKQLFTVVLFNDAPIMERRFHRVKPSGDKLSDLDDYLDATFPSNGTEPMGAMSIVLQEDYDVIFLLSDGEFDANAIDWIRQQNSKRIVICTISLGADSQTLRRIAKDSGGRYKAVK